VNNYARRFEKVSRSAVSLAKSLLYEIDGLTFSEALQMGSDVNVVARMTEDCKQGVARFLKK
jgi:methylglutaconyl-CoA hydratase